ncbi:MAG: hypothetical protein EOO75_02360, partial [Myxococcales bacterium]
MTTDWVELAGYPRVCRGRGAYVRTRARYVNGVTESRGGRPVMITGGRALSQAIELEILEHAARRGGAIAAIEAGLAVYATHLESIEYVRQRGTEVDLACRAVGVRGAVRVYLDLGGPIGRFADQPLPDPPRIATKKKAPAGAGEGEPEAPAVLVPRPPAPLPGPAAPLVLAPLLAGASPVYGNDALQLDPWNRLWIALRLADTASDYHYLVLGPDGAQVALLPLATRDELLAQMGGRALGGALLPGLAGTPRGVWRFEHYQAGTTLTERAGPADSIGPFSTGAELKAYRLTHLGVAGGDLLRWRQLGAERSLELTPLAGGKRRRVKLPPHPQGLYGEATLHGSTVRVLGRGERHPIEETFGLDGELRSTRAIDVGAASSGVFPLPQIDAVLVARGLELWLVHLTPEGRTQRESLLLCLPARLAAPSARSTSWNVEVSDTIEPGLWTI